MNRELADQLRDIHGLDAVSWWPLAPGWWLLMVLGLLLLYLLFSMIRNLRHYPAGTWNRDAWKQLRELKQNSPGMSPKELAAALSELARRIAVAKLGREEAASISGTEWLTWLEKHDPAGFPWTEQGTLLLRMPYAPAGEREERGRAELIQLLDALTTWTSVRRRSSGD